MSERIIRLVASNGDSAELGPTISVDAETGEVLDDDLQPTGRSLEDLTDEYVPPFVLNGVERQLSLDAGNDTDAAQVVGSQLRLKGGKFPLTGQFRMGSRVRIELVVEVESLAFAAIRSTYTKNIIGIDRVHTVVVESAKTID